MRAYARQCDKCGMLVTPRGGAPPRFCPTCGQGLAGSAPYADRRRAGDLQPTAPGGAVAALVFGILSFVPMVGLILGIAAIATGVRAKRQIEESGGQLGGQGLATAGITLGIIGAALWTLICAAAL